MVKNLIDIFANSEIFNNTKPFSVHRLDKDTSGVFIMAKHRASAQLLTSLFRLRKVHKTYLAICHGELPKDSGVWDNDLTRYDNNKEIVEKAKTFFDVDQIIITDVDKKAYLSSLKLADYIVVSCDSTSMISEAAMTGKPIYVAQMPTSKKNKRFDKFFDLFKSLNIIKDLGNSLEEWNYDKLSESDRISGYIKEKIKNYDFS